MKKKEIWWFSVLKEENFLIFIYLHKIFLKLRPRLWTKTKLRSGCIKSSKSMLLDRIGNKSFPQLSGSLISSKYPLLSLRREISQTKQNVDVAKGIWKWLDSSTSVFCLRKFKLFWERKVPYYRDKEILQHLPEWFQKWLGPVTILPSLSFTLFWMEVFTGRVAPLPPLCFCMLAIFSL